MRLTNCDQLFTPRRLGHGPVSALDVHLPAGVGPDQAAVDRKAAAHNRLQERMVGEIDRFSPEALVNQWLSTFPQNVERMQDMFAQMFLRGAAQDQPRSHR